MEKRIIVDSCCDLTQEMRDEMNIVSIPLTMALGDDVFRDDESLDLADFKYRVSQYSGKTSSASPSPYLFEKAIEGAKESFVVTLSSKLSGSYGNAVIGNGDAVENGSEPAHVFDSKSASAGETLIAIKLHELIKAGMSKVQIVETVERFISELKTYFVLQDFSNLQKNGRLGKITGTLIQMLNIKLVMGADGNGDIALYEKCRGITKAIQQLVTLIERSGKDTKNENLVISHCNNPSLAEQLKTFIQERCQFKKIYIVPTGGLSTLYADDKGIVMAF